MGEEWRKKDKKRREEVERSTLQQSHPAPRPLSPASRNIVVGNISTRLTSAPAAPCSGLNVNR